MRNDYITRLVQICLDIANIADERGEADEPYFEELGLGYRALSGILRRGCKEIIDLQNNYHGAIEAKNLAKIGEKEAHDVLEEMFGDREVYTINDNDKERIRHLLGRFKMNGKERTMRAIDADAFDERVRVAGGMSEEELTEDFKDGVQAVLYMLSNQPTIQPEITHEQAVEYLQSTGWMREHDLQMMLDGVHRLTAQPKIVRCKDCKHWIPYDWMFSEVWQSQSINDYPEDEMGCELCDMSMKANDFCSRADRRQHEVR